MLQSYFGEFIFLWSDGTGSEYDCNRSFNVYLNPSTSVFRVNHVFPRSEISTRHSFLSLLEGSRVTPFGVPEKCIS